MSPVGRACALCAVALAVVTVAFWDSGSPPASSAAHVDGAELFHAKGCASCHDGPESAALIGGFPPLLDATDWAGQRRPEMTARAYLAESILEPNAFISPAFAGGNGPATAMPSLTLTPDETDALIDYLLSK
jgi:mono/diheme cytochrome c family protein